MLFRILLLFIFVVSGCSLFNQKQKRGELFKADLLLSPSADLQGNSPAAAPTPPPGPALYVHQKTYRRGTLQLLYLASQPARKVDSPTFQLIDEAFREYPVRAVLIEGIDAAQAADAEGLQSHVLAKAKDGYYPNGETSYAIEMAYKHDLKFFGGEPDKTLVFKELAKKSYSEVDLLGFLFVRQVPSAIVAKEIDGIPIEAYFKKYTGAQKHAYQLGPIEFSYKDFLAWYKEKNGKEFSKNALSSAEAEPLDNGKLFTQKLSADFNRIRDENFLRQSSKLLKRYKNLLVIYNSARYRMQKKAIEATLGRADAVLKR